MTEYFDQNKTNGTRRSGRNNLTQRQPIAYEDNRESTRQLSSLTAAMRPIQRAANKTGLPDNLKSGMENLSGMSLDHVNVHYNSPKPATVQAHAYAQGSNIHLASGQESHLPHELGHVVQQAQGRVKPTTSVGGIDVNDSKSLEDEATRMGAQASRGDDGVAQAKFYADTERGGTIQRALFENNGEFIKRDRDGAETSVEIDRTRGHEQDEKTSALNSFADYIRAKLNDAGYYAGPHIAVSVQHKRLYVAVNTKFDHEADVDDIAVGVTNQGPVKDEVLLKYTLQVLKEQKPKDHAEVWIWRAGSPENNGAIIAQGNSHGSNADGGPQNHAEMRILHTLLNAKSIWRAVNTRKDLKQLGEMLKVIRMGGTLKDCKNCSDDYVKMEGYLRSLGFFILSPKKRDPKEFGAKYPTDSFGAKESDGAQKNILERSANHSEKIDEQKKKEDEEKKVRKEKEELEWAQAINDSQKLEENQKKQEKKAGGSNKTEIEIKPPVKEKSQEFRREKEKAQAREKVKRGADKREQQKQDVVDQENANDEYLAIIEAKAAEKEAKAAEKEAIAAVQNARTIKEVSSIIRPMRKKAEAAAKLTAEIAEENPAVAIQDAAREARRSWNNIRIEAGLVQERLAEAGITE